MSNLPPGVSGFSDHFGPNRETEEMLILCCENGDCDYLDIEVVDEALVQYWNDDVTVFWTCPFCLNAYEFSWAMDEFWESMAKTESVRKRW